MPVFRLERLVTSSGSATRSQARTLIKTGRVLINGAPARAGMRVDTDRDIVTLDGEPLGYVRRVVYMMNKPKGVVTATEDGKDKTVLDLMDDFAERGIYECVNGDLLRLDTYVVSATNALAASRLPGMESL